MIQKYGNPVHSHEASTRSMALCTGTGMPHFTVLFGKGSKGSSLPQLNNTIGCTLGRVYGTLLVYNGPTSEQNRPAVQASSGMQGIGAHCSLNRSHCNKPWVSGQSYHTAACGCGLWRVRTQVPVCCFLQAREPPGSPAKAGYLPLLCCNPVLP